MFAEADSLLQNEKFDAVLATALSPMTLAVADKLFRKHRIPWVADFRDIPTQHKTHISKFSPNRLLIKMLKGYCRSASAVVTVSKPLAERLTDWMERDVSLVYNGFDPDDFTKNTETKKDVFSLVYCGSIHDSADPAPLLDAMDMIVKKDPHSLDRFEMSIYGVSKICFRRYFESRPCSGVIQNKGRVPFSESIKAQQQASALLFLSYLGIKGILTAKIFEYLGAGRPILSVPGDGGVTDELLDETRAGVVGRTAEQIADILEKWMLQWQSNGKIEYEPIPEKIQVYTRKKQTEKLAHILDQAVAQ
jgi:glycosyltransferase involved in cell wall biosynthesis